MDELKCNLPYEQLSPEELVEIEYRMYPGNYSQSGFLQQGDSLIEVIDNDKRYLRSVNITYKQIVDRIETIIGKYYRSLDLKKESMLIENKYKITSICSLGAQECPFQNKKKDQGYHGHEYGNADITIVNIETGESITFSNLLPHMIVKHHFFESPKSLYRLDPSQIIRILDIKPNIDYQPTYKYFYSWDLYQCGDDPNLSPEFIQALNHYSLKKYNFKEGTYGFIFPTDSYVINNIIMNFYIKGYENNLS